MTEPVTRSTTLDQARDAADLDNFNRWAARWMRRRLDDGARKFGALSWRRAEYSDADNIARLYRAVEHLTGVLSKWRDPATAEFIDVTELGKRAADVANQAFMLADIQRREGEAGS